MLSKRLFTCDYEHGNFRCRMNVYSYLLVKCRQKKKTPFDASVASLRSNFLLYISSSAAWEACYSCRCHRKSLSLSPLPPSAPSLHVFAALIPRQVSQHACSVGSPHLIVCYFFNTYIMYFIRICCQSLSVSIHPISVFVCVCVWGGGGSLHQINH